MRNQTLTLRAFRDYQAGRRPSGPGARSLLAFFASVERQLEELEVTAPRVKRSDQELLSLLASRAGALHLGLANYCWFLDPGQGPVPHARPQLRPQPALGRDVRLGPLSAGNSSLLPPRRIPRGRAGGEGQQGGAGSQRPAQGGRHGTVLLVITVRAVEEEYSAHPMRHARLDHLCHLMV
ncbi:hypothetical protein ACFVTY_30665 [Streptomyces sp. NPDC058067]|uniref:hypothetical protein n=1 Tax=Streptomyces sp. NPDC058067 TaxID=3346324 RepID=UPI0036E9504A